MHMIQPIKSPRTLCPPSPQAILYGASWCPTSLRLRESLARHPALPVVWADIDACPQAAKQDAIQGIPTLVLRRNGAPTAKLIGMRDIQEIIDWLIDHGLIESQTQRRRFLEWLSVACLLGSIYIIVSRKI